MLSRPIVEIKRGLQTRASAARYPKVLVSNRCSDVRASVAAIKIRPISAKQIGASTVGPVNTLISVSSRTFSGDVAVLATYPGKKPQVPLLRTFLT